MTVSRDYQLAVDWSRQGIFVNTLEDVSGYVDDSDITVSWGRNEARSTEDPTAGRMAFALMNISRQFSPENTSSPIAGRVLPGTRVRLNMTVNDAVTTLFDGPIETLTADPNAAAKTFTGDCSDGFGRPGQERLSTPVYQGKRTGDLIHIILDEIGWPADNRSVDAGATLIPYWWVEGQDAATAIADLVHSEGPPAVWWVQAGVFYFRDRHHRLVQSTSTTSQGTYTHVVPEGSGPAGQLKILKGSFGYDHGLNDIVNAATLEVTPRVPGDVAVVWSSTNAITLANSTSTTLTLRTDEPFTGAVTPVEDVDFVVDAGSVASVSLSRDSGQSLTVTITAGGGGAVLLGGIQVRASPLTAGETYQYVAEDAASIATFGRNTWSGSAPWAYLYDADSITQRIVAVYSTARPVVTLRIADLGDAYAGQITARDVSDRITVRNDELGLNADYVVERVTHTVKQMGRIHELELGCQVATPDQPANVFTFDTTGAGFNQGSFGVFGVSNAAQMFTFDTAGKGFNAGYFAA